jgi:hypothetical protein
VGTTKWLSCVLKIEPVSLHILHTLFSMLFRKTCYTTIFCTFLYKLLTETLITTENVVLAFVLYADFLTCH